MHTDVLYYKYMYIVYYMVDVHLAEVHHFIMFIKD